MCPFGVCHLAIVQLCQSIICSLKQILRACYWGHWPSMRIVSTTQSLLLFNCTSCGKITMMGIYSSKLCSKLSLAEDQTQKKRNCVSMHIRNHHSQAGRGQISWSPIELPKNEQNEKFWEVHLTCGRCLHPEHHMQVLEDVLRPLMGSHPHFTWFEPDLSWRISHVWC